MCLKSLCPRFCSSKQSFKQSSQVQKSTGVTCDPLFIRTQQQQCHVRHSHCDIIRKKQAVTELFQLLTKKKNLFSSHSSCQPQQNSTNFATFVLYIRLKFLTNCSTKKKSKSLCSFRPFAPRQNWSDFETFFLCVCLKNILQIQNQHFKKN